MFINPNTYVDVELPIGSVLYIYSGVNSTVVASSVVQGYSIQRLFLPVTVDGVASFGPYTTNLTIRIQAGSALAEYAVDDSSLLQTVTSKLIGTLRSEEVVVPDVTFDTLTYSDNGGLVNLVSVGAHGLTAANSNGRFVYVTWAGGDGVDGFYEIDSLDADTVGTEITIVLDYVVGLGTPTVAVAGDKILLGALTVPANSVLEGAALSINAFMSCLNNADTKTVTIDLGGATVIDADIANSASASVDKKVFNIGAGLVRTSASDSFGMGETSALSAPSLSVPMYADQDIEVFITPDTADNPIRLDYLVAKTVY